MSSRTEEKQQNCEENSLIKFTKTSVQKSAQAHLMNTHTHILIHSHTLIQIDDINENCK